MALSIAGALALALVTLAELHGAGLQQQGSGAVVSAGASQRVLLDRYCVTCHNETLKTAGLTLDTLDVEHVAARAEVWGKGRAEAPGRPHATGGPAAS